MNIRMCEHLHCGGLLVLVKQSCIIAFLVLSVTYESGPQNSGLLRFDFANCTNATMFWVDSRAFVPLSASLLHSPNNIIILPVRSCSMAGFGYKDLFKLVSARPRLNGM